MVGLIFLATVINYLCRQAYSGLGHDPPTGLFPLQ